MKRVLVLSDTHGHIDEQILKFAKEADEVWHAGDWGPYHNYENLENLVPLRGVFGNIDGQDVRKIYKKVAAFTFEGVRFCIVHIAGYPGKYNTHAKSLIENKPNVLICGHSHILKIQKTKTGMLHINPGAAGHHGFHKMRTMVRFVVDNGRIFDVEVIELGKRGLIKKTQDE